MTVVDCQRKTYKIHHKRGIDEMTVSSEGGFYYTLKIS